METFTIITAPSGKFVIVHDIEPDEYIPAHAFQYYDRRLGLERDDPTHGGKAILPFSLPARGAAGPPVTFVYNSPKLHAEQHRAACPQDDISAGDSPVSIAASMAFPMRSAAASRSRSSTWAYRRVILGSACPSIRATVSRGTPRATA